MSININNRCNLKYLYIILFFIVSTSCFAEYNILKELDSGKAVVLIINSQVNKSEQYADWAYYLNQFSSKVEGRYVFHKISADMLNKLALNADRFVKEYSMIFMKRGKPSYFYKGAIVEPQVYRFIKLTYSGKAIKPEYLKQFSPKKVEIELR